MIAALCVHSLIHLRVIKVSLNWSHFTWFICYINRCASKVGDWMHNEKAEIKIGYYDRLVINIADGNLSYLSELYLKLKKPILAFALSILGDYYAAEDIVQDTFLKISSNASSYHKGTNARAWIFSIARNLCFNSLKSKKSVELTETIAETNDNSFEEKVASAIDFNQLIKPLDETEKQIFVLHFYGGLKKSQIARIMDISPVNVRAKYFKSFKKAQSQQ